MRKLQGVIFDLDGVITDTAHYHFLAWRELANKLGIDFTEKFNEELKGISRDESLEKILQIKNRQNDFTVEEKRELATEKNINYLKLLKNISPKDIYPGIKELLNELKEENIKIALASASKNAIVILEALELKEKFDCIVDPESVEKGKPSPDIFLKAAELIGVNPSDCIGVEDAIAGINAIKSANMASVGVGTVEEMKKAGATFVVEKTEELNLKLLENIIAS